MQEEWISITEAARRLSASGDPVDRSTLSRYLKQHAEALPLKPAGKSNLVDYQALRQHRGENIRLAGRATAPDDHPVRADRPGGETPGAARAPAERFPGSQNSGAARKALADAELKEMDLAQRRGKLTIVDEVDAGGRNAVALMATAFDRAIDQEAASLSVRYGWDERAVRLALKGFARKGTEAFHREMLKLLDGIRREEEATSGGDMPETGRAEGAALQ